MTPEEEEGKRETPPDRRLRLVDFVNLLETAHQHYNLKQYLREECAFIKHDSNAYEILIALARNPKLRDRFNMIDAAVMGPTISDHIFQLEFQERERMYPDSEDSENSSTDEEYLGNYIFTEEDNELDENLTRDPIYELVRKSREEGYIMDEDLRVELDKIETDHPSFYNVNFNVFPSKLEYMEKEVLFWDISADDTEQDIEKLVSAYGEIKGIDMYRSGKSTKTAIVTYKYPEAAKIVTSLNFLGKMEKWCTVRRKFKLPGPPMSCDEVGDEVSKAKDRYKELRNSYLSRSQDKEDVLQL